MDPITRALTSVPLKWSLRQRMKKRVKRKGPDQCWPWIGNDVAPFGHGLISVCNSKTSAARAAYALRYGLIPDGLVVCHKCDNPSCCNPRHLFLGTQRENIQDMWRKGRGRLAPRRLGTNHHAAKLTEADVRAIRDDPRSTRAIAKDYGINQRGVCDIKSGKAWKSVE
jgi:hypothetical protein